MTNGQADAAVIHIIISLLTLVIIPVMLWTYQRNVAKREHLEKENAEQWRQSVTRNFESVLAKVTTLCTQNSKEHDELYTARNKHEKQLESIETIHHQRGCDQPYARRVSNGRGKHTDGNEE